MIFKDGFWVVGLGWNALKLRNRFSVFEDGNRFCSKVYLAFEACPLIETPSRIYRESDGMVWRENESGFLKKGVRLERWQSGKLVEEGWLCYDLVSPSTQSIFILTSKRRDQEAWIRVAVAFVFNHFGKFELFAHGSGSLVYDPLTSKLPSKHVTLWYTMCYRLNGIIKKNDLTTW